MQSIPLETTPNQQFSISLDDHRYVITLNEIVGGMCAVTIVRDDVTIISGARAVAGFAILPYKYMQAGAGNFAFVTVNGEYPYWENFNTTQQLIYASEGELNYAD